MPGTPSSAMARCLLLFVAIASCSAESTSLSIHRRRECPLEQLWTAGFHGVTSHELFTASANASAVWTRMDSCANATHDSTLSCTAASNVVLRADSLALSASSSSGAHVAVRRTLDGQEWTTPARLRVHARFPNESSDATIVLSLPRLHLSLTLVSRPQNATHPQLLRLKSSYHNFSALVAPPCPHERASAVHTVDLEWAPHALRWYWDGHALHELLTSSRVVSSRRAPALLAVDLSVISSTTPPSSPAVFHINRIELQRVAKNAISEPGGLPSICWPRFKAPHANCRHHKAFQPRLGDDAGYLSLSQVYAFLHEVPSRFPPGLARVEELGRSTQNRSLLALCVGACSSKGVPQVLFTGMHHSREPVSMMNLIYTVDLLALDVANGDLDMAALLFSRQLWFLPVVNPDGYARNEQLEMWATHRSGRRKNARGMGNTTSDTCLTDPGDSGVDLNRNYDVCFDQDDVGSSTDPCGEDYRGPAPFSEPETLAIKNLVERNDSRFSVSLNYHSFGRYFNVPFACQSLDTPKGNDLKIYESWAKEMTFYNGFQYGQSWKDDNLYSVNGETSDWLWSKHRIFSMSPEVGPAFSTRADEGFWPEKEDIPALSVELHYSNLVAARISGPQYELRVTNVTREPAAEQGGGIEALLSVAFQLENHGLSSAGDVEIILSTSLNGSDANSTAKSFTMRTVVTPHQLGSLHNTTRQPFSGILVIPETSVLHLVVRDALSCELSRLTMLPPKKKRAVNVKFQQWQSQQLPPCGVCRSLGRNSTELSKHSPAHPACDAVKDLVRPDDFESTVLTVDKAAMGKAREADLNTVPPASSVPSSTAPIPSSTPTASTSVSLVVPSHLPSNAPMESETPAPEPSSLPQSSQPPSTVPTPAPSVETMPAPMTKIPASEIDASAKSSTSSSTQITNLVPVPILATVGVVLLIVVVIVAKRRRRHLDEGLTKRSGSNAKPPKASKATGRRKNYVKVINEDEENDSDDKNSEGDGVDRAPRASLGRLDESDDEDAEYGRRRSPKAARQRGPAKEEGDDELV